MSEQSVSVSAGTRSANRPRRGSRPCAAQGGETVAVLAHNPVADVVPSGEIERLRETIEVRCAARVAAG